MNYPLYEKCFLAALSGYSVVQGQNNAWSREDLIAGTGVLAKLAVAHLESLMPKPEESPQKYWMPVEQKFPKRYEEMSPLEKEAWCKRHLAPLQTPTRPSPEEVAKNFCFNAFHDFKYMDSEEGRAKIADLIWRDREGKA